MHKVARHLAVVWSGRFVVSSFPDKCDRTVDKASRTLEGVEFHSAGETFSKMPVGRKNLELGSVSIHPD